ncbi:hypothetical protein Acr_17g0007080 [Actinidia rufa]|uniref:Uncharacterized protein n=1 Tax=Actinidia rufa TaxID=165716 RepID=A0A7J0G2X4_9ERIC|nr:hypothetical protein Acr_17g0007080 [Actinidia rufa]
MGVATPKRVFFALDFISGGAVISPVVYTWDKRCSHDNLQSDVLYGAPRRGVGATSVRKCEYFDGKWSSLLMRVISQMLSCRSYGGVRSEVVKMDNLMTLDYLPVSWTGRLLSLAHIFGPKPGWLTWSVHVRMKLSS